LADPPLKHKNTQKKQITELLVATLPIHVSSYIRIKKNQFNYKIRFRELKS